MNTLLVAILLMLAGCGDKCHQDLPSDTGASEQGHMHGRDAKLVNYGKTLTTVSVLRRLQHSGCEKTQLP